MMGKLRLNKQSGGGGGEWLPGLPQTSTSSISIFLLTVLWPLFLQKPIVCDETNLEYMNLKK